MIENNRIFNSLENLSYTVHMTYNEKEKQWNDLSSGFCLELQMQYTYLQLIEVLRNQLCLESNENGAQQYRNHLSTLQGFLTSCGKTEESRVGHELKSGFDEALKRYLVSVNVSDRSKSDRRYHLNKWLREFELLSVKLKAGNKPPLGQFNLALSQGILDANISQANLLKSANISKSVLSSWIRGAYPNKRSSASIRRVEIALGLPRNLLADLAKNSNELTDTATPRKIEYRDRQASLKAKPYRLQEIELSPELLEEWSKYFSYKTSTYVSLERTRKGKWRLKPIDKNPLISQHANIGTNGSATAEMVWQEISAFLGFLRLPKLEGGFGLQLHEVQTLAWFAHHEAINAFLEFVKQRSDGICHHSHKRFAGNVISLTANHTGYLLQQPEFLQKIPVHLLPKDCKDWGSMCAEAAKVARTWKAISTEKSRDPRDPIAPLLALAYPLEPILRAIRQLDSEAAAMPDGGILQARLKRDALLLAFLISNPLRILNFKIMKYNADNPKHLYKPAPNQFRLKFSPSEMKTKQVYDVKVADWLVNRLDEYIEEFREVLLEGTTSDYLFISSRNKSGKWEPMDRHVFKLTKRLIPETLGFGPHAFRHLVATDWLSKHPDDLLTVASLLNDNLQTVIANYFHNKHDQSFIRYEEYMLKNLANSNTK